MIYGLAASVLVMVLEMVLFIIRAVRMEYVCEQGGGYKEKTVHHFEPVDISMDEDTVAASTNDTSKSKLL